jgi:hypothetical protein
MDKVRIVAEVMSAIALQYSIHFYAIILQKLTILSAKLLVRNQPIDGEIAKSALHTVVYQGTQRCEALRHGVRLIWGKTHERGQNGSGLCAKRPLTSERWRVNAH